MKKFLAMMMLAAFAVTMFPITTAYASVQTVECSWWGNMVNGTPTKAEKERERQRKERERKKRHKLEQQRRQQRGY